MSSRPRLLAPVVTIGMLGATAAPQAARPDRIPGADGTWTLPNRVNANTVAVITAPAG
jgi:hypothetical protein